MADRAQALAAAARKYFPTDTLTRRIPPENVAALHRWPGFESKQPSVATVIKATVARSRK